MDMIEFSEFDGNIRGAFTIPRLDIMKSSELLKRLQDAVSRTGAELVLDVSELDFIDSAILGVFIRIHDIAHKSGKKLVFTNLSDYTRNMFQNSGLAKVLHISS